MPNSPAHPMIERITSDPLLLSHDSASLFTSSLKHVIESKTYGKAVAHAAASAADDDFWPDEDSPRWLHALRPYNIQDGVLQIPVMGVLLNRFPYQWGRWATGYDYIEKAFVRGMEDANVNAIALVIDSPGGEVAGNFELVDRMYEARGTKPIRAFAADHAYSAAYSIASAADDIIITRSGGCGSIGVVMAHVEYAEAMAKMGIKVTYIFAGKHKVDGNPYETLSDQAKTRFDERIQKLYGVFVSTVARNRDMDEQIVRDTEALTYDADGGIEIGLADRLGALEDEMSLFAEETAESGDEIMATKKDENTMTQEQHDTAVASAVEEATASATTAGATAERTRIKGIIESDEGQARPKAALHTALNSNMSLEDATAFLGGLDEEAPAPAAATTEEPAPKGSAPFDDAMQAGNVTLEQPAGGKDNAEVSDADAILGDYYGQTGLSKSDK